MPLALPDNGTEGQTPPPRKGEALDTGSTSDSLGQDPVLAPLGHVGSLLIFRALPGLGDFLCSVPALRALRSALPEAHITLLSAPEARALATRFGHYLDEFLQFPGYPGLPERRADPERTVQFLGAIQRRHFDVAVQLHGSGLATNPILSLFGARRSVGHYLPGFHQPDPFGFVPYPATLPEIRRHLHLLAADGYAVVLTGAPGRHRTVTPKGWEHLADGGCSLPLEQRCLADGCTAAGRLGPLPLVPPVSVSAVMAQVQALLSVESRELA